MKLAVFVERISDGRYSAKIWQPFQIESEGHTVDEAVERIRELAASRLGAGQLIEISIPDPNRPPAWARWAGIWKDNPDFDEYVANIEECRRNAGACESSS